MLQIDGEYWLDRKSAAKYINKSPGTLSVWDCIKRYDLQPKKFFGRVHYNKNVLDQHLKNDLIRQGGIYE